MQYVYKEETFTRILKEHVSNASIVIGNLVGGNQSVFLGLGVALSENKPILLIAQTGRALSIPTELSHYRLSLFSLDNPELFIETLGNQVENILEGKNSKIPRQVRQSVFISYSHKDLDFLNRLMIHLKPLDKAGVIETWVDTNLKAGDLWKEEIERALKQANVAILLVSADFMASEFIVENELPPLLEKAATEGTRIIPVIVKHCRFSRDKNLSRFQTINNPQKPLISMSEDEREKVYDEIAMQVEALVM